ncbi:MAG: AGE family epimerase/isomerase [Cytophagaceae bacterium]|nr:AGE family epimerase/isomerase [Cytophagaceae bacterium]
MPLSLPAYAQEVRQELQRILTYWQTYAPDPRGGFYGRVDAQNQPDPNAAKAIVLNARILWTFSMAHRTLNKPEYRKLADRAFVYIRDHFFDRKNGGVYWLLNADGSPKEAKKQLYGHSFALYGLAEYVRMSRSTEALALAKKLYQTMEQHAFDPKYGGYFEAFAADWGPTDDYILSKGDARKSMNTSLHLLEAYTNLCRVWPDAGLHRQTRRMLEESFLTHILDPDQRRMRLFFTDNWTPKSGDVSYGHDIEASWLLYETAEVLEDKALLKKMKDVSLKMANATLEGLNPDGALTYELNPETGHKNQERSWWVLSEQMVGYLNAYQLSGKQHFLEKSLNSWAFVKQYLLDQKGGEWFIGVNEAHQPPAKADKITAWKCPYHNGRACEEVMRRLRKG